MATYALYAIIATTLGVRLARPVWRDPHRTLLLAAVACLGVSVIADQVGPLFPSWHFMEAAAQLLGTLLWFAFAFCASRGLLRAQAHMERDVRASTLATPELFRRIERQPVS